MKINILLSLICCLFISRDVLLSQNCTTPQTEFIVQTMLLAAYEPVTFDNTSIDADFYQWYVNGQLTANTEDFVVFFTIGEHIVKLTAYSVSGVDTCSQSFSDTLTIGDPLPSNTCFAKHKFGIAIEGCGNHDFGIIPDNSTAFLPATCCDVLPLSGAVLTAAQYYPSVFTHITPNNIVFKLVFKDVECLTGLGFNDPSADPCGGFATTGEARREIVYAVLDYVTSIIDFSSGGAGTSANPYELYFPCSIQNSTGLIASAATYMNGINPPVFEAGFFNSHITNGTDPDIDRADAIINTNFATFTVNNSSISIGHCLNTCAGEFEFDFYSIMLHEITHTLGFYSNINANGSPKMGNNYTLFDKFAFNGSSNPLIDILGNYVGGVGAPISNSCQYISNNSCFSQPLDSQSPFATASNLSHFDNYRSNWQYVMNRYSFAGTPIRFYTKPELEVLSDLGYTLLSNSNICVTGVTDYATTPANTTVCISVLANDQASYGSPQLGTCGIDNCTGTTPQSSVSIIYGGGNVMVHHSGQICYTPALGFWGTAHLQYCLQSSTLGGIQNTEPIDVFIEVTNNYCADAPCNLICNGGFEIGMNSCDLLYPESPIVPQVRHLSHPDLQNYMGGYLWYPYNVATGWNSVNNGTPDIVTLYPPCPSDFQVGAGLSVPTGFPLPYNSPNNRYAHFLVSSIGDHFEGIFTKTVQPLEVGKTYRLEFWFQGITNQPFNLRLMINNQGTSNIGFPLNYANTFNTSPIFNIAGASTSHSSNVNIPPLADYATINIPQGQWGLVFFEFQVSPILAGGPHYFIMEPDEVSSVTPQSHNNYFVDDISLTELQTLPISVVTTISNYNSTIGQVDYEIVVCNNSTTTDATNLEITNYLPPALDFLSSPNFTWNGNNYTTIIPFLGQGGNCVTLTFSAATNSQALQGIPISNCAEITAGGDDCASLTAGTQCATFTPATIDISITKNVLPTIICEGQTGKYIIEITNNGTTTATNVQIQDNLPVGMNIVFNSHAANYSGGILTIPTIPVGGTVNWEIVVQATVSGLINNTAVFIGADQPDINAANNSDDATIEVLPFIPISITTSATYNPLTQEVVYTVNVCNQSSTATANNITITDLLPLELDFVGSPNFVNTFGNQYDAIVASLLPNDCVSLSLTAQVNSQATAGNTVSNCVNLLVSGCITNTGNNCADFVVVASDVDIEVQKTASATNACASDVVQYTITITNIGSNPATEIKVADPVVPISYQVATNPANISWNISGNAIIVHNLNPTESVVWTIDALPLASNCATLLEVDQNDVNPSNNSACVPISITPTPPFSVVQFFNPINTNIIQCTVRVCNTSSLSATYNLQNVFPSGWALQGLNNFNQPQSPGALNDSRTLVANGCIDLIFRIRKPNNSCDIASTLNCVTIQGTCPLTDCQAIPLNILNTMGLPSVIPTTVPDFETAIDLGLLLDIPLAQSTQQNVQIQGTIQADLSYVFATTSQVTMNTGAQITVPYEVELHFNQCNIHGCNQLWRSITVEPGGLVRVYSSTIEDGLYALEALPHPLGAPYATIAVESTQFNRNYVSIYTPPSTFTNTASIGLFGLNRFDCTSSILPAYANTPVVTSTKSFAGIEVNNLVALTLTNLNIFRDLSNGIIARQGHLTVIRSRFENILRHTPYESQGLRTGDGIFMDALTGLTPTYTLKQQGFGSAGGGASFVNCWNGIRSIGAHMDIRENRMTGMRNMGIESRSAANAGINIDDNNIQLTNGWGIADPLTVRVGINLWMNDANASPSPIIVSNNTINAGEIASLFNPVSSPIATAGIRIQDGGTGALYSLTVRNNNIRLFRAADGIFIGANTGAVIENNTINFRGIGTNPNATASTFPRRGIALRGCQDVLLSCNQTTSTTANSIFEQTTGIAVATSRVIAQCNSTSHTRFGMHFNGACNNSIIEGNRFEQEDWGLFYTNTAVTGGGGPVAHNQSGNQWIGNFTQRGAQNNGASGLSLFTVSSNTAPEMPPNRFPLFWFVNIGGTPLFVCSGNCTPPIPQPILPPTINNADVATANNQLPIMPTGVPWELRKGLYNKLDKNPQLQLNPTMGQFYTANNNQVLATVVAAEDARKSANRIDSTLVLSLTITQTSVVSKMDSIVLVDSLYTTGQINSILWQTLRQQYLSDLSQLKQNLQITLANANNQCQTQSQQAMNVNAAILPTNTPEQNEVAVNEIYLQTIAIGNISFTPTQIQTLYNIAHQCPDEGGSAVYRARAIYAGIAHDTYNDNCSGNAAQSKIMQDTCWLEVPFINPSLEDTIALPSRAAPGWNMCENSPDIHPAIPEMPAASHGNTYAGQVAHLIYTESISQLLADTLLQGHEYAFLVDLAGSLRYLTGADSGAISVYLTDSVCKELGSQFVGTLISKDSVWTTYMMSFVPNQDYTHIIIASEPPGDKYAIIDNFRPVPCDTTAPVDTFHVAPYHEQTDYTLGIEMIEINNFNIYPNPNIQGQLTIDWGSPLPPSKIVILDALGRKIGTHNTALGVTMQTIDIQQLASGYYTVLLENDKRQLARAKLIVVKE